MACSKSRQLIFFLKIEIPTYGLENWFWAQLKQGVPRILYHEEDYQLSFSFLSVRN